MGQGQMSEIPKPIGTDTIFMCGPVSSGKTWLLKKWVEGLERSVTVDSTAALLTSENVEHITGSDSNEMAIALCDRLESNPHYYRIAYHPINIPVDFEWAARAVWQLVDRPRWLIVDEVQRVCGDGLSPMMELICQASRHALLGFIGAAQRIADVNKSFTSSCRMVILFYTAEVRDIEAIQDRWGSEISDEVTNLRPCIYNDATKVLEQAPECIVWVRGLGYKKFSLGDKIKTSEGTSAWDAITQGQQKKQEQPSSEQDFGRREQSSEESTSEPSSPSTGTVINSSATLRRQ